MEHDYEREKQLKALKELSRMPGVRIVVALMIILILGLGLLIGYWIFG